MQRAKDVDVEKKWSDPVHRFKIMQRVGTLDGIVK